MIHPSLITETLNVWQQENKVARLWAGDATLWTNTDESQWLGWLNVAAEEKEISRIETLANDIKTAGFSDVVVLGMGGSSLCPDMMAKTFGPFPGYPRLHILDSTDPDEIHDLEKKIDLKKTFFIVSSKSGTTLEPNIFKDYFYSRVQKIVGESEVGNRFLAITDPGTALDSMAKKEKFKAIFYGVPSIGGRYSALSNFGMVPAGLMGVDVRKFLNLVTTVQTLFSPATLAKNNPGVTLGVILGTYANQGKNKITFIVSPAIHALGAWLEQLLAESTGKNGKGLIPVDQEPLGDPAVYSDDRVFIYIRLTSEPDLEQDRAVDALEKAGFIVERIYLQEKMELGAELFRWEIATAVAGSIMGINPFNQPDVEESKVLALKLTSEYEKTKQLNAPLPFFSEEGLSLYADEHYAELLTQQLRDVASIKSYLTAHLNQIKKGDYVDLSAFIDMSEENTKLLQESRVLIRNHKKVATCLGFGPRFLHSTGQAYKGGPNTGVFLQLTADYSDDIPVPGHQYTFGLVIAAQAQADFAVLVKRSRRVLRIHLGKKVREGLEQLREYLL